jgi:ABC-type Fe3+/spermidine/putrescine transport system ATPase subunit
MHSGSAATLMVRPEELQVLDAGSARAPTDLEGQVVDRRFAGAVSFYRVRVGERELLVQGGAADGAAGDPVLIRPRHGAAILAFPEDAS